MKHCLECGCLMHDTHEADICEVCTEEMGGLKSDIVKMSEEDEESLYPRCDLVIDKNPPNFRELIENRIEKKKEDLC